MRQPLVSFACACDVLVCLRCVFVGQIRMYYEMLSSDTFSNCP